jgi:hypothetical protein
MKDTQGRRHHRSWGIYPPLLRQLGAKGGQNQKIFSLAK